MGDPAVALPELARAAGAGTVVWAAGLEPEELADDDAVAAALADGGVETIVVPSANLLFDPAAITYPSRAARTPSSRRTGAPV